MKVFRGIIWLFAIIFILLAFIIACLILFFDPNQLKPELINRVKAETGYQIVINDKLHWSIYPRIGIKANQIALIAPNESQAFIELQNVFLVTDFKKIFNREKNIAANLYVSDIKLFNIHATNAQIGLTWFNKKLALKPINAQLYQGNLSGEASGLNFDLIPNWNWDIKINQFQVKPLLEDVNGTNNKIKLSGLGQFSMQGGTSGRTHAELMKNLTGKALFSFYNGVLEGIDLNYLVNSADALFNKQLPNIPMNLNQTSFDSLTGFANITNGVAHIDNLLLVSQAFVTKGTGTIDFTSKSLDYRLQTTPKNPTSTKWIIPILIVGNFHSPVVRLDMQELNGIIARSKADQIKTKVQEEIKKLPEKANKFLKHLLGT